MLSSPADRKTLRDIIQELDASMTRVDAEKDLQKEMLARAVEELGLKKALVSKLAKIYHTQSIDKVVTEKTELEDFYEELFTNKD
jgi:ATP phosphoribosyltransferase regulatory subunit HisZ